MAGSVSGCPKWYFTRKEIEENSPSRRDGIDLKKEAYLRKSYCSFLQELGMKLKVPQVTIATAIILCHRFFFHQSHAKNDRKTIAAVCMFLSGKSEETPRPLKDVIVVSYEIIHKKDPAAIQKIKQQKEVYEQQKELFIVAERVVLTTLGFDLCITHSYGPLVEAIKRFKVAENSLAQVAWNFVNDGLRTSLCLQFKPKQIAAGAIFLAAKFLKVKLPTDGEKVWWQEFDVTPRQLEDVSNQLLELYEQNSPGQPSHANEASMGTVTTQGQSSRATEVSTGKMTSTGHAVTTSVRENSVAPSTTQDKGTVTVSRQPGGVTFSRSNWCQSRISSGSNGSQISQYKGDNIGISDNKVGAWDQNMRSNWCQSRISSGSNGSQISQYKGDNIGISDNKVGAWDQNMDGVGRHRSRDELGPPSYGSINTAESSSHLGKAELNDVEVTKRKHEVSTEKSRSFNHPSKESAGTGWSDHAEREPKRLRVEGHV